MPQPDAAPTLTIVAATKSYESWLARQTPIVAADLRVKHAKMASDPFTFLRATYYRWLQVWRMSGDSLQDAPHVLSAGDLHIENFGTWRDEEGRLIWGINDLDEASVLPYLHDLIRLATSAAFALRTRVIDVSLKDACRAIVEGYSESLNAGGRPIILAERHQWLRRIAIEQLRDPIEFWRQLRGLPTATQRDARAALQAAFPQSVDTITVARRVAGAGSLGRQRFVGIGLLGGSSVAREAKALIPSAAEWLGDKSLPPGRAASRRSKTVRVKDPFLTVNGRWIVRRLAPDCIKVDLAHLPRQRDDRKLLRAMGWETANLHLESGNAATLLRDLAARRTRWLEHSVQIMSERVLDDWRRWRAEYKP